MAHRIRWLNQALRELFHHCEFLADEAPKKAALLEEEAFRAVEILERFPTIGRLVPDVAPEHRAILIAQRGYWLVYRSRNKVVTVVAIISTLQDFPKAWHSRNRD
ncbi:MAG: type II toxin-antitoxin system RelE/ParE family toxin [Candidatus Eremiobacteraeota bacterium]|nr:type II toxin-antitoxin system RelE/ParE family toxin [Candidatus Eremiobacteraeota bacterium]